MLWALNTTPPPTGRAGGTPWQAEAVQLCTSRDILNYFAMENTCNCGDTRVLYYPDENQHEPACWECYYSDLEKQCVSETPATQSSTDLPHPDEWPF